MVTKVRLFMNEWNLKLIYESEEDFEADFNKISDDIKNISNLKGKLNCPEGFIEYAKLNRTIDSRLNNVFIYAAMAHWELCLFLEYDLAAIRAACNLACNVNATRRARFCLVAHLVTTFWTLD